MPIPSPFFERQLPLCRSMAIGDWAGYAAVASYEKTFEREYNAFRQGVGMVDVTPLHKVEVKGPDAARLLSRVLTRSVEKIGVGRVIYACWCDEDGKLIDDGTITRIDDTLFFVTAAECVFRWLCRAARRLDVSIEDVTEDVAVLALQGPNSRALLAAVTDIDMTSLTFFKSTPAKMDGGAGAVDVRVSRTGYTGDLGYEVWMAPMDAIGIWDTLMHEGKNFGIEPCGMNALDVVRIEAGFVMAGVDFFSAPHQTVAWRKSTPYEVDLGWTVQLDRAPFIGQDALRREVSTGPAWSLVGLEIDWSELEGLYAAYGLPPALSAHASRAAVPVYDDGNTRSIGQVTSSTWSPILKRYIALASVPPAFAAIGTRVQVEHTVAYERRTVSAHVVNKPFFDPPRKRA